MERCKMGISKNQTYQVNSNFDNVDSDGPRCYPFFDSVNKGSGSCNTIDDLYPPICIQKTYINGNVFN